MFNLFITFLENSIVLTYVGGDRDKNVKDTCKGLRWTTYLTFLCEPTAIHVSYDLEYSF